MRPWLTPSKERLCKRCSICRVSGGTQGFGGVTYAVAERGAQDRVCEEPHASLRSYRRAVSRSGESRNFGRRSILVHRVGEIAQHDRDDFSERTKLADGRSGPERVRAQDSRSARGVELVLPPHRIGTASAGGEVAGTHRPFAEGRAIA